MSSSCSLVWLITGTSTGVGRELAMAALGRGDKVIATARARSLSKLDDLKALGAHALQLDVTDSLDALSEAANEAVAIYGRIDVLVNNAGECGYIEMGALEEVTPEQTVRQYQTNVFGALNVSRAFLPYMREKRSGTIAFLGSQGGWRLAFLSLRLSSAVADYISHNRPSAMGALYLSSKFAIRCLSESLHEEISPLGLRSICFDLGFFRTDILTSDHRAFYVPRIDDYKLAGTVVESAMKATNGTQLGDPKKGAEVMIDVIKGEGVAKGRETPLSVSLGSDCYNVVKEHCESHLKRIEDWKDVSFSTDFLGLAFAAQSGEQALLAE